MLCILASSSGHSQEFIKTLDTKANRITQLNGDSIIVQQSETVYRTFSIKDPEQFVEFEIPKGMPAFDGQFVYLYNSWTIRKLNRHTQEELWSYEVDSKWGAQWVPGVNQDYVVLPTLDYFIILDKNTGEEKYRKKKFINEFEDGIDIYSDLVIGTKWNGQTFGIDPRSGKKLWAMDVGEQAGYGAAQYRDDLIIPSWDPRLYSIKARTGKKNWVIKLDELDNGCGSGFTDKPLIYNDKIYALQRDNGLYVFEAESGKFLKNVDEFKDVLGKVHLFQGYLIFRDTDSIYIVDPLSYEILLKKDTGIYMRASDEMIHGQFMIINNDIQYTKEETTGVFLIDLARLVSEID